jgi:hypothetical protein
MKIANWLVRMNPSATWSRCIKWLLGAMLIISPVVGLWLVAGIGNNGFRYPAGEAPHGRLRYINNLPVLQVEGTPEQIGTTVARLAVQHAEALARYPRELFFAVTPDWFGDSVKERLWRNTLAAGERLINNLPERYKREYQALRQALPEKWHDSLLAGNTLFDIKRIVHCSAVVLSHERVQDPQKNLRGPILGRNLDFPTLGYLHHYSLIMVYKPQGKFAFVAVGFPGLVGVLSGMNEHGLCVAMLEVYESGDDSPSFNPRGIPYAICLRHILEECRTVAEAKRLISSLPRTCYYNLAVCDRETGGVLEVTPKQVVMRTLENGLCACTNHFLSEGLAVRTNGNFNQTEPRLAALLELGNTPKVSLEAVQQALHRANQGKFTMQTMVFEPSVLRLYLAMGQCPSSALPFVVLEAGPLLVGQPAGSP